MFREMNARSYSVLVAVIIVTAFTTFASSRLLVTYAHDWRLTKLELQIKGLESQLDAEKQQTQFLYDRLADVTFDRAVMPSTAVQLPASVWQKNRDEELRRRLLALEQWRLQQQTGRGR